VGDLEWDDSTMWNLNNQVKKGNNCF
jgi:hypothetical protein